MKWVRTWSAAFVFVAAMGAGLYSQIGSLSRAPDFVTDTAEEKVEYPDYIEEEGVSEQSSIFNDRPDYDWKTNKYNLTAEESCTAKNLFSGKEYVQKIRDQKSTGWCYSFGETDMLSYHEGRRLSAVGVAASLINLRRTRGEVAKGVWNTKVGRMIVKKIAGDISKDRDNSLVEESTAKYDHLIDGASLFITPILGSFLTGGYCDENELNDEALMNLIRIVKSDSKWYHLFEKIRVLPESEYHGELRAEGAHGTAPVVKVDGHKAPDVRSPEEARTQIRELLAKSGFTREQIEKLHALSNSQTTEPLKEFKRILCPNPKQLSFNWLKFSFQWSGPVQLDGNTQLPVSGHDTPVFQVKRQDRGMPHRLLYEVHEALENDSPAAMTYDVGALWTAPKRPAMHISLIVGRRWNAQRNQCEFLVKNSWGRQGTYKKDIALKLGKVLPGHKGDWEGYFWLPETSFIEAMHGPKRADGKVDWFGEIFWIKK